MFFHHHHHRHDRDDHHERHFAHRRFGRFIHEAALRGRHMRHGGGRVFDQGDLRWVILKLIADKPSHGYELIKAIEERLGGAYSPSPGVVYPTLTLLEELGYVTVVQSEGARKAYGITEEGTKALEENQAAVDAIFQRIDAVAERAGGGPAPQVVRAMENLRTALRLKLEQGKLNDAQVAAIAQALDAAARDVEGA
jgi:DNA-binding PadR family transcriptional regulator